MLYCLVAGRCVFLIPGVASGSTVSAGIMETGRLGHTKDCKVIGGERVELTGAEWRF